MSPAARTIRLFGLYLFAVAFTCTFLPNLLMQVLGQPPIADPWFRFVGMLVFFLGYYYWTQSGAENRSFFEATVRGRIWLVTPCFVGFMLAGWLPPVMLVFAVIDVAGALWTRAALARQPLAGASLSPAGR